MFFTHPIFLIALSGVAIPIIIHLVRFHRYRKVYFSNTELLQELQSEMRQRSVLREWLVLAARVLTIVFLVLAFVQPCLKQGKDTLIGGGTAVSIYIDNSYSMGGEAQDGILLETAKNKASEIAAAYPPDTKIQLVTNDASYRLSQDELKDVLGNIQLTPNQTMVHAIMSLQDDYLQGSGAVNIHSYIISDFQRTMCDWEEVARQTASDIGRRCTIVPLSADGTGNVFIDTLWFNTPKAYEGAEHTVTVRIKNTGNSRVESLPVRLYVGGEQRAMATVDVDRKSQETVSLTFTIRETGCISGRVETTDYPVTFDDCMYFSIDVSSSIEALTLYDNKPNIYLNKLFASDSLIHYSSSPLMTADLSSIENVDIIIMDGVRNLSSGLAQILQRFVSSGGTLVLLPTESCDLELYNMLLAMLNAPQFGVYQPTETVCTELNNDAAVYSRVFKVKPDNIELPRVSGYFPMLMRSDAVSETIIKMANGDDYLSVVTHGNGVLYLFAVPLEEKYTDFMQQSLFVPTIYNMALYSQTSVSPYYTLGEGETIELKSTGLESSATMRQLETGEEMALTLTSDGSKVQINTTNMQLSAGNYSLLSGSVEYGLSFNYDRKESIMDFFSKKEIAEALKDFQVHVIDVLSKPLDQVIKQNTSGKQLWRYCVIVALIMMLAEILLLRWPMRRHEPI